jgi:hypothetical protein
MILVGRAELEVAPSRRENGLTGTDRALRQGNLQVWIASRQDYRTFEWRDLKNCRHTLVERCLEGVRAGGLRPAHLNGLVDRLSV